MARDRFPQWLGVFLVLALVSSSNVIAQEARNDTYLVSLHDGMPYYEEYPTDYSDGIGVFLFDQFYGYYYDIQFKKVRFYHEMPAGVPYSAAIIRRGIEDDYYRYKWADPNTYVTTEGPCWAEVDISHSPEYTYHGSYEECYGVFIRFFYGEWLPLWVDATIDAPMTSAMILDLGHEGDLIEPEHVFYNSEGTPYGWTLGEWLIDVEVDCIDYITPTEQTTFSLLKQLY